MTGPANPPPPPNDPSTPNPPSTSSTSSPNTPPPADARLKAAIAAERRDLAALLADLRADQWDAPSLCAGWRVREVAAHMSMGFRYSLPRVGLELLKSGGNLHRTTDRLARADAAALSTHEIAAALADNAEHPWKPPGGRTAGLGHDVVHGLDITVALGLDRTVPEDRLRILLDAISPRGVKFFGVDLTGVQLRADDLDWSYGTGTPLTGSGQDLLLVAFGRRLPPGRLRGEHRDRFVAG
ncbi:maleylpyruvate isomerase family mycothiol-dependent enzyme (plasmid) [Embleya sp. NBC_00888]|uniref:maleylpyruvate isomerase family mycothiol-dependent enzyme n=1 Tax=Embleya sp. NBC_00888 TaxID=2975960 RepID=UPI002F910756|nr:maleylpyruvate isomerase family mycothiol-dependent enzyme [Embleya sp. NBC_00888]